MKINRVWAMPSSNTFDIKPIGNFVKSYLQQTKISVDPFSRNKKWTTFTNDLNPNTDAEYHLEALTFLNNLQNKNILADVVIFDPPYSPRQISECYQQIGRTVTMKDTQGKSWSNWKTAISKIVPINGIVLSFGWNTVGMGKKHGFEIIEILLVCHGGMHNDTICMAEKRISMQKLI